ncbi:MAG: ATP-binding protein [Nannocystaceae bacterium]|nr:ATP-binding protein [bacterium]
MADGDDNRSREELRARLQEAERELAAAHHRLAQLECGDTGDSDTIAELRRSEELARRLIEAMPGGVVHVAATGAVQTANAEALRILGMSYDELSERYTVDFETQTLYEDGRPCPVEDYPVSRALATGEAQPPRTIGVRRPDGETSWAVFTAVPVCDDDGTTQGAVVTFLDITKRKQLEAQLREAQKMEAIGRLAGGVAHDFNNLLTVIVANAAEVLDTFGPGDPREEDLEQVVKASQDASRLTGQLLAFARKQVITPSAVDLNDMVRDSSAPLRQVVGEGCDVHVELAEDLWPVSIDRGQFEQVLVNLVLNARDAVGGQGRIEISTLNAPGDPGHVILRVRDDGEGMDADVLERVFEPFFSTKEHGRGTGLGLATCYGIATQAGGTIEVESRRGEGTTIEVRIPRAMDEGVVETPTPAAGTARLGTILLIEDEDAVRRIVKRLLERHGYRVLGAASGKDALSLLSAETTLDLVLSDVMMPVMTGPEVVARVQERFPDVPVLYMSGYSDDTLAPGGVLGEGAQLLRKPFEPEGLIARLRELTEPAGT